MPLATVCIITILDYLLLCSVTAVGSSVTDLSSAALSSPPSPRLAHFSSLTFNLSCFFLSLLNVLKAEQLTKVDADVVSQAFCFLFAIVCVQFVCVCNVV